MVETHTQSRNKRPGLPDLPPKHQKAVNAELLANGDDALTGRVKAGAVKKPGGQKSTKEQKVHAAGTVAQLEISMEMEDVEKERLAVRQPSPTLNKVSRKPSTGIWSAIPPNSVQLSVHSGSQSASQAQLGNLQIIQSQDTDEAFIIAHVDVSQNEHDNDSLLVKISKGQKLHRDIENVKDSLGGGKRSHSKQHTCSDDEGAPATAGGMTDSMKHPLHNTVKSGGFEDEQEDDKECQAGPRAQFPTPIITDGDNNILTLPIVSVSKSVSPINRMPAAIGEEQEGNALDDDLLVPDSENEVDRAPAVDIECEANPSINAKTKYEFKAQSKADRNTGEEGEQETVNSTSEGSDNEDIMHHPVTLKPSHGSFHDMLRVHFLQVNATLEDSDDEEIMHCPTKMKPSNKNTFTHIDQETTNRSNKSKTRVYTTPEGSDDEELLCHPMNVKPFHRKTSSGRPTANAPLGIN
ncbi:uncharacterized protein EDB93DRAFT_1253700 [Suillus bovinus]|uniref:uncharacterized protein n=1 Tax=Suillus bovinus TaxID=48563 RepID=UPI001B8669DA|nr:uncharacterized protein EDB93DRAFT_1253700 [Suillus bovinus]KAG2137446.1 hypothetical protein EDB93DRAFT_1253700 [Suillus bovinus]